jgi:hypothetical protein
MEPQAETPHDLRKLELLRQMLDAHDELHGTDKPTPERAAELRAVIGRISQELRALKVLSADVRAYRQEARRDAGG